ncbi:MAG: gas vesicle protein GvpK [Bacillota bacterium]
MHIDVNDNDLKQGVLGLVFALVDIIKDTLKIQAYRRMDGGSLSEDEVERLGLAIMDLEEALESIKIDQNLIDVVESIKEGLDDAINEIVDTLNPARWVDDDEQ